MKQQILQSDLICVVFLGLSLRAIISLHPYSGASSPPMYGDYEAQRHWQEITFNLPPVTWYKNSTNNDLQYWGLDYPPLTAYHSYLLGLIGYSKNSSYVELFKSHGFESKKHKSFMRYSVLLGDIAVYLPASLSVCFALEKTFKTNALPIIITIMLYPGQILIDNGHFQYNNISLGLAMFSISAMLQSKFYLASFFFTLALNYKQMELYHALPIFVFLLRMIVKPLNFIETTKKFVFIASTVIITFGVLWIPWLQSFSSIFSVLNRLFPVARGIFEDKVANFWCVFDVIYKMKTKFTVEEMVLICLVITLCAIIPPNVDLFINCTNENFLRCLFNTAMSFFLFSFQVHEKSILLVVIPAFCLLPLNPIETIWFLEISSFSMLPLLMKDSLSIGYYSLYLLFYNSIYIVHRNFCQAVETSKKYQIRKLSNVLMAILSVALLKAPTHLKYPYIWSLSIAVFSFAHFFLFYLFNIYNQLFLNNKIIS